MSPAALFAMGVLVTLVYGTGLSLLVWGAILDGRDEARRKAENDPIGRELRRHIEKIDAELRARREPGTPHPS